MICFILNTFLTHAFAGHLYTGVYFYTLFNCQKFFSVQDGVSVSTCPCFDPSGYGEEIWKDLQEDGKLDGKGKLSTD